MTPKESAVIGLAGLAMIIMGLWALAPYVVIPVFNVPAEMTGLLVVMLLSMGGSLVVFSYMSALESWGHRIRESLK